MLLGAAVLLGAVCAESGTDTGEFPTVAVTVDPDGRVLAVDESRDPGDDALNNVYIADEVVARVRTAESDDFEAALYERGLTYYRAGRRSLDSIRSSPTVLYLVFVPPGAAMAAREVVSALPGAESAWVEYLSEMYRPLPAE